MWRRVFWYKFITVSEALSAPLSLSLSDTFSCTRHKYTDPTAGNVQKECFTEVAVSFYWTANQRILDKGTVRRSDLENLNPHIT